MNMKHTKWLRKSNIALMVALCVTASFTSSAHYPKVVLALTQAEAEKQKDEAEKNEENAQSVLDALEEEQNELIDELAELDSQATELQKSITDNTAKAQSLQDEIDETQVKLDEAQAAEDSQYEAMMQRIQYLYEEGSVGYLQALMSSISYSDMLNKSEYIDQISEYDQKQLQSLVDTRTQIANYEESLEADLKEVEILNSDLEDENAQLQSVIDEKETQISKYDDDISAQKQLTAKFTALREQAEARIAELARQAATNAEANGTSSVYTIDGTVYDTSAYAGRFMWPVATGGTITSYFGNRTAPTAGASTYHRGLDIGCTYGSDIVAADDGTVILSSYNGGGGNMVMIDHGDGVCTVYMHNSQLCVNVGEKVVKGQVIAKAGSTGVSTGPHCHFGVSINGTYVNPLDFL
jgi:murein DD-endopeptidase MepM/ murein hydrolase activator NlpD